MTEQLVPATPKVEHTTQSGSRRACVGSDALSAADELVAGVAGDLQQVIMKMKQATHVQCTPSSKFGTNKAAVLHTLVQVGCLFLDPRPPDACAPHAQRQVWHRQSNNVTYPDPYWLLVSRPQTPNTCAIHTKRQHPHPGGWLILRPNNTQCMCNCNNNIIKLSQ